MNGEVEKSIGACESALKVEPDFPIAHNNLAIACMEKGDFQKAIQHADRAVELGYEVAPEIMEELADHRAG
jgi:tetratricopeptide (TPR) repeat protein